MQHGRARTQQTAPDTATIGESNMANAATQTGVITQGHKRVIFASSLGTVFEWYDFYLYGSLAAIIGKQFFSGFNETTQFIFALLAFAAGPATTPSALPRRSS
jgi:hypothetical protein